MLRMLGYSVLALLAVMVALVAFVIRFSASTSAYHCHGEIVSNGETETADIYAEFEEYAWWVGLWSRSDGSLWVESPGTLVSYFSDIRDDGRQLHIFDHNQELKGRFSSLSRTLMLELPVGFYEGNCQPMPPE